MGKLRLRFWFFSWFFLVAGSQKKSRNSQIGCPGAAKSDLFDGGHDVGDHWSDVAELPDQRGLHFGQGDLWLPCHTAGLLFWILLHSDDEIFQDLSGWSCFLFSFFWVSDSLEFCVMRNNSWIGLTQWGHQNIQIGYPDLRPWCFFIQPRLCEANPRLDIVVQTINHCSVNVVHFAIVFLAIFLCYAFAGHFLLGHMHKGWDSMLGSLFMLWSTELTMEDVSSFSVPVQAVCYLWSLTYQILVQQAMLFGGKKMEKSPKKALIYHQCSGFCNSNLGKIRFFNRPKYIKYDPTRNQSYDDRGDDCGYDML